MVSLATGQKVALFIRKSPNMTSIESLIAEVVNKQNRIDESAVGTYTVETEVYDANGYHVDTWHIRAMGSMSALSRAISRAKADPKYKNIKTVNADIVDFTEKAY